MAALTTFRFSRYTLRPAYPQDLKLAKRWTEQDPAHRLTTPATFWLHQAQFTDSYVLEDEEGPIFFIRMDVIDRAAQLHIQFMPLETRAARLRTQRALVLGLEWLERILVGNRIPLVFFDSENSNLIRFSVTRLGFTRITETRLSKRLIRERD